ncbi:MAG: hypothetical protein AAF915_11210 [Cyanobacteria bacterium P01_D01_bin.50]
MTAKKFNPLFRVIVKALKYFSFIVFGFLLAAFLSEMIGTSQITINFFPLIFEYIWRAGIILLAVAGAAVLIESFR